MPEFDPLHERVTAMETDVARLSNENATTRVMAAMADRDVAEFRTIQNAHTKVLNALRDTQVEHGHVLGEHTQTLRELQERISGLRTELGEQTSGLRTELHEQTSGLRTEMTALRGDLASLSEGQTAILRHLKIEI